jgi:serine/threonine protein kinase
MCIITELLPRGDLEALLQDKTILLSLVQRMKMAKDAALGMAWLHGSKPTFIHRDLKTANLLIDANFTVKVCDFGLSQIKPRGENLRDGAEGAKGTPLWMAPEVMLGQPFNEKADIYSFGIVLWEILTRSEPFQEFDSFEEFRTAVCYHHRRPVIPDDAPPKLKRLIERCWHPTPTQRPSFPEIVDCLDEAILEIAIADEYGRKFWSDCFRNRDQVKWNEFTMAFRELLEWSSKNFPQNNARLPDNSPVEVIRAATTSQLEEYLTRSQANYVQVAEEFARRQREGIPLEYGYNDPRNETLNFKCLHAVLADPGTPGAEGMGDDVVSMEKWGKILAWFGPLVDLKNGVIILDKIRVLLQNNWFHGDISTKEAENRLIAKGPGAFLIRFSTSAPGTYTMSKVSRDGSINHQRILYQPGAGFFIHNKIYPSLEALVTGESREMGLTTPSLGSKYSHLFVEIQSGYIQAGYV